MHRMQHDTYYRALQIGNDTFMRGHFYNGQFYEGKHFIGQIDADGSTFRFFASPDDGRPSTPEHIVGFVEGLTLTLNDGSVFDLLQVNRDFLVD